MTYTTATILFSAKCPFESCYKYVENLNRRPTEDEAWRKLLEHLRSDHKAIIERVIQGEQVIAPA